MPEDDLKTLLLRLFDELKETNGREHKQMQQLLERYNGRLRALENWRVYIVGIAIGAAGVGSTALKFLF